MDQLANKRYKKFILQKNAYNPKALFTEMTEEDLLKQKKINFINSLSKAEKDICALRNPLSIDEANKRINVLKSVTTLKLQLGAIIRMDIDELKNLLPKDIKDIDIVKEMSLIIIKKSDLSAALRNVVKNIYGIRQLRLKCKEIVDNAIVKNEKSILEDIDTITDGEFIESKDA